MSKKTTRVVLLLGLLASFLALPVLSASAVAPTQVTMKITGTNKSSVKEVLIVGPKTAVRKTITAKDLSGTKTIALPASFKNSAGKYAYSVHLIGAGGKYLGPVSFKTSTNKYSVNVIADASKTLDIKNIELKTGYGQSNLTLGAAKFGKVLTGNTNFKPAGAGTRGLVKRSSTALFTVLPLAGVTCQSTTDQTLGADCDSDGIINALDADDDGDKVLDIADTSTKSYESQKFTPWSTLFLSMTTALNANIGSFTREELISGIEAAVGGENTFGINFFLNFTSQVAQSYDAVWVDCGSVTYCANTEDATAIGGAPSQQLGTGYNNLFCNAFNSGGGCESSPLWRTVPGALFDANFQATAVTGTGVFNGLVRSVVGGNYGWAGAMQPRTGAGTLSKVIAGDPYILKLRSAVDGAITEMPVSLGGFFITVPAIKSVNGIAIDYEDPLGTRENPIVVDSDGIMDFSFWRPQRQSVAAAGETSAFMDMGGLRYGLIFGSNNGEALVARGQQRETGCTSAPGEAYVSVPTGINRTPDTGDTQYRINVWPLTDTKSDSAASSSSDIDITFDFGKCFDELAAAPSSRRFTLTGSGNIVSVSLTAVGVDLGGGASRGAQTFYIDVSNLRVG
ncbi:MAG: thrombospondin type 3 repeat-containing protein [Actinobacteria bacterium]|nr:thrombospondin type 3 repeat-containing protein [Actinomycetota bacterium]